MQKVSRQILIELMWLVFSFGLTLVLVSSLFGWSFSQDTIDIHLHDTMFVISRWHISILLFFMVAFSVYFIKEFRESFRQQLPNWLLFIIGSTFIIWLTSLIQTFSQFYVNDWTLYPPLSALGPDNSPEMTLDPATRVVTIILTSIQIVVLLMLLFFVYRWGTMSKKKITEEIK